MNLRRIKHTLLRLNLQEKIIGVSTLIIMISCFFPWYTKNIVDKTFTEYGFSGDLGVIGVVIFLMSLLGLLAMVSENMHLPFPKFGHKRENIVFFFMGETAFLSLLTLAIYTKQSLDEFSNADLRFGLYLVICAAFFSALSAFALIRKIRRKEALEFFEHETPLMQMEVEEDTENIEDTKIDESKEGEIESEKLPEEALTFEEDASLMEEIEKEWNAKPEASEENEEINEKSQEIEKNIIETEAQEEQQLQESKKNENLSNQGKFFNKEAGVGEKKEDKPNSGGLSMGFYEDK